jgi:hypothetical protein
MAYLPSSVTDTRWNYPGGDGSDGDVTIAAPTTLTANMYYDNLIVDDDLETDGYLVFCKTSCTVNAAKSISADGGLGGAGGTGGSRTRAERAAQGAERAAQGEQLPRQPTPVSCAPDSS